GAVGLTDVDGQASVPWHGGAAFYGLRPYLPGDDSRLIHWPATARTGQPIVRHTSVPDAPAFLVVLDNTKDRYPGALCEEAVRVAASLCVAAVQSGTATSLRTTDGPSDQPTAEGDTTPAPLLDFLAGTATHAGPPQWPTTMSSNLAGVAVVTGRLGR